MASIWDFLDSLPKRGDVSPEELARRRQGYADLYQGGLLAGNRDQMPLSVQGAQATQDFLPVIGDALALGEAGEALSRGELAAAGLLGAGAAIGLVPGAGDALAKPVMAAGRRAADIARRIEVDPNAIGSMGGNIRLRPQAASDADEITLFHGSPYDFRNFDTSQIGKGEGAQDLGRGFSLTDEEIVAHSYMNPASRWGDLEAMERYRQAGPGRTYQVGVKARPDQILDWKKPWKEQVPEGTPLYDKIQESVAKSYADDPEMQKLFQQANLSSAWRDDFGMEDAALKSGFVGNKRQNFSGDTEFTVFDPSKMEIKKVFDNEGRELPLAPATPAQEVAGLLSSGRADEVTDEMLAKFTPKDEMEIFDLYQRGATGMDLPMDEASRMARAQGMGFDTDLPLYHGTGSEFPAFDTARFQQSDFGTGGAGVYSSEAPSLAGAYADLVTRPSNDNANILPIVTRRQDAYDTGGYRNIDNYEQAREYSRRMQDLGVDNVYYRDNMSGEIVENVTFDPANIRSRFARFDPRLAHLRNLSAGVGGLGLLSSMMPPEEQY